MQQHSVRVEDIQIGERHRALSVKDVERLASSLRDIGLRQPISVRIVEEMEVDGELTAGVPVLVAGRHRLEAAKQLGWSHIDCLEVDDDDLRAELWEIDENLMRAELTPAQQAEHLARRKEVWSALSVQIASKPTGGRPGGFASDTAKRAGVDKSTVTRAIARANAIGPDIKLVAGTSLDTGVELDALARMPETERHPLIARAAAGEVVSARPVLNDQAVIINQANAIIAAWNRACLEAREIAMDQMDSGPVFDRSRAAR